MDPALDRFFDVDSSTDNGPVAAAKIPPFFTQTLKTGSSRQLTLSTRVSLSDPRLTVVATRERRQESSGYNLYVVAVLDGAVTTQVVGLSKIWVRETRGWGPFVGFPIGEYLRGVATNSNAVMLIDILESSDLSTAVGTRFFVGYGTSSEEMLSSGRFRLVYEVPAN